jgi:hypothetical protein
MSVATWGWSPITARSIIFGTGARRTDPAITASTRGVTPASRCRVGVFLLAAGRIEARVMA